MTLLSRLRIRSRLLLGVLIPVVITAATLAWITVAQIKSGGEAELERLEASLLSARKEGLKNLVDTARSMRPRMVVFSVTTGPIQSQAR